MEKVSKMFCEDTLYSESYLKGGIIPSPICPIYDTTNILAPHFDITEFHLLVQINRHLPTPEKGQKEERRTNYQFLKRHLQSRN